MELILKIISIVDSSQNQHGNVIEIYTVDMPVIHYHCGNALVHFHCGRVQWCICLNTAWKRVLHKYVMYSWHTNTLLEMSCTITLLELCVKCTVVYLSKIQHGNVYQANTLCIHGSQIHYWKCESQIYHVFMWYTFPSCIRVIHVSIVSIC